MFDSESKQPQCFQLHTKVIQYEGKESLIPTNFASITGVSFSPDELESGQATIRGKVLIDHLMMDSLLRMRAEKPNSVTRRDKNSVTADQLRRLADLVEKKETPLLSVCGYEFQDEKHILFAFRKP